MRVFTRTIDHGNGTQLIITDENLVIEHQEINAHQGHYAGDGNPEFVGKKTKEIKNFWKIFTEVKGDVAGNTIESYYNDLEDEFD
jgi:hypothetical protein